MSIHTEHHFTGSKTVRDLVLGISDGLTVPFALAAGLAGVQANHWIIVVAATAEIAAGAISMGLGGYLATKSEAETYESELKREYRETDELPEVETEEVRQVFSNYGLKGETLKSAVNAITSDRDAWVQFMMREELGLEKVDGKRAFKSGFTIGSAYILGGAFPLLPYLINVPIQTSLLLSAILTLLALAVFGWVKGKFTGVGRLKSAFRTAFIGGTAAGVAYLIARLISGMGPGL